MDAQAKTIQEKFSLEGKVCVITGAEGFLGKHYVEAIKEAGGIPVSLDSAGEPDFKVDITQEEAVRETIEKIVEKHGKIDVLINNAAMNPAVGDTNSEKLFAPVEDYPAELWVKELGVNLTGMFLCSKAVVPAMKKQGKGVIVNVASEVSEIAHDHRVYNTPGKYKSPAYVTTKTGVIGLTRALAAQLGQYNIRVNAFSPGGVENPAMPKDFVERFGSSNMLSRMAQPDEYNGAILFLSSDASSFMTGHNLVMDGGKSAW
jgi:NAD(P)-dependent dehydrogenase (short-subunit alcohol dehydrogenase family)